MSKGLVSTFELLDAVEAEVAVVMTVLADGKVSLADIGSLPALISNVNKIVSDFAGASEELKDLDKAEVVTLLGRVVALAQKLIGAFVKPSEA